ncbi:hypothetical protein Suden_1383 [Sulfurimonas denitrificans DSM 1251]|jgi:hypothetical protein|uniref:Uncharacterized protein n=1 Tax=Sulfurimonas denitrificans (strain ATCC 33889 / DSM 1251) TaxID=326298 RepID=Q30QS1_SULDN|nr:hypothetical protein [Sulfurimonas denitrificans]ABB44660.1 hypothetical protein Suden_1383 [Sulfurimonas denitrificans DSM 1251]MDD3442862.1 hypothetical protein [Sulfurimonas denitrificans]
MKITLIILLAFLLSKSLFASELGWIDEQIETIKLPRKGVVASDAISPFVFLKKNSSKEQDSKNSTILSLQKADITGIEKPKKEIIDASSFDLSAIINSSAMINGNWHKINDVLKGYTLFEIDKDSVILKQGDNLILLSTATKKEALKFKNN